MFYSFEGKAPTIKNSAFIAPSANLIGDVIIGDRSSVWYNCTLRGDVNKIEIGNETNIQDNTVIHVRSSELNEEPSPTKIGDQVTVGHGAILHACELHDSSFVGMGAILLDFSIVESQAMVAAGALITSGTVVKSGELWAGRPARKLRDLTLDERDFIYQSALSYADFAHRHLTYSHPTTPQTHLEEE